MSTDLKLSKAQICKIIQSGGFLGTLLSKLASPLKKIAIPLAKNVLAPMGFLILPHPLVNLEIQKYQKNEPRYNGVFSRNNLPKYNSIKKIKDGADIINLDEYANVGTNWIALFCKKKMKLFISIVLVLNIFLKKLKNLLKNFLEIKI